MSQTLGQYDQEANRCRELFVKKMIDYGTAWRVLRIPSLVDQMFIKAKRIRTLEEEAKAMVADPIFEEYIGIVNYGLMALIQLELGVDDKESDPEMIQSRFDYHMNLTRQLMIAKNHDYGEAWRSMQRTSLTDLILMKVLRVKQIIQNQGQTLVSEGLEANFMDMINYAIFALIKLQLEKHNPAVA